MGAKKKISPLSVNTDITPDGMKDTEGRFIKGLRFDPNANGTATSGANMGTRTKLQSNAPVFKDGMPGLPEGFNLRIGGGYSPVINKYFYFNFNDQGNHGIYLIDGDTMVIQKVLVDTKLNFSDDPRYGIPEHSIEVWVTYDSDDEATRKIKEIYLLWTDANNWQGWVNVIAAVKTNGFDAALFPYWTLKQPHFDRRELFEWAVRPIMQPPVVTPVPVTDADKQKHNAVKEMAITFAVEAFYTDGRPTTLSQWSNPVWVAKDACNINSTNLVRCYDIKFHVGGPMVERVRILFKTCDGDWRAADTIDKFSSCDENDPKVIGEEYWLRTNAWQDYQYDPVNNTAVYRFCNDKDCKIVSQPDAERLQSDLPLVSTALTAVGNAMLLADNKKNYDNRSCEDLKNIQIGIETIEDPNQCKIITRKIRLYAFAGKDGTHCQVAYTMGDNDTLPVRYGGITYFPGIVGEPTVVVDQGEADLFGLTFGEKKGPLMYLEGTSYYAIGKQYKVNADYTMEEFGIIDLSLDENKKLVGGIFEAGGYFIWVFDFLVENKKYIARLAGQEAGENSDYAITSTFCYGITNSRFKQVGPKLATTVTASQEMEVDACLNDIDVWGNGKDMFYMFVPYQYKEGLNQRWRFITGNVYEDNEDKVPVELMRYVPDQGFPNYARYALFTDHNGFYWAYTARGDAKKANVDFWSKFNCTIRTQGTKVANTANLPAKERGYHPNTNVYIDSFNGGTFGECNRVLVRGKITDCDGVTGLGGVNVSMTRGGRAVTKSDGTFEMVVHNSYEQVRTDRIYFNTAGLCLYSTCNCGCDNIETYTDAGDPCVNCQERVHSTQYTRKYKLVLKSLTSLKGGGRYAGALCEWDYAGRCGFLNELGFIDVPTFLEQKAFSQSFMNLTINGYVGLGKDTRWVSFFRSNNLNYSRFLQWVGDKIEFLNAKGEVVESPSSAVRARVVIQSLNEFNKAQNFGNTTNYQFAKGDSLRIYDNGQNVMFDPSVNGFMDFEILGTNWDEANEDLGVEEVSVTTGDVTTTKTTPVTDGKSFLIPFDKRLIELKDTCGFWIEIITPRNCAEVEQYCEMSGMYPVINGVISEFDGFDTNGNPKYIPVTKIIFYSWDTYYQRRSFNIEGCGGKIYNHPFESSSITDYWGKDCGSCGRRHVKNENVTQRWYPNETIKSDEFVNDGGYNGLGTFRESNIKIFKGQQRGPIVAVHAENSIIVFVCTDDWFMTDFNQNFLRATEQGVILATLDDNLGEPRQKIGAEFGVSMENRSAVLFFEGYATWADNQRRAIILMDYKGAYKISDIDNTSYFHDKLIYINKYNEQLPVEEYTKNVFDIIMGFDPKYNEILVTFRPRRNRTNNLHSFVNDERETILDMQETFVFNLNTKNWVRFAGYAPEGYGHMSKAKSGVELLTFANGYPYAHNSTDVKTLNTFYGIKTQSVLRIILNEFKNKVKILQKVWVESNPAKMIITSIRTDEKNAFSYLPEAYFKKKENIWYAEVLRDMNSYPSALPQDAFRIMLIDGKRIFGEYMDITFVGDLLTLDEYVEINDIQLGFIGSEQSDK